MPIVARIYFSQRFTYLYVVFWEGKHMYLFYPDEILNCWFLVALSIGYKGIFIGDFFFFISYIDLSCSQPYANHWIKKNLESDNPSVFVTQMSACDTICLEALGVCDNVTRVRRAKLKKETHMSLLYDTWFGHIEIWSYHDRLVYLFLPFLRYIFLQARLYSRETALIVYVNHV